MILYRFTTAPLLPTTALYGLTLTASVLLQHYEGSLHNIAKLYIVITTILTFQVLGQPLMLLLLLLPLLLRYYYFYYVAYCYYDY